MKSDFLNIVLYEPEIPQNTGNIARLCACLGAKLYLVGRLGFILSDKYLKRAGLDYWDKLEIEKVDSLDELLKLYPESSFYYFTTKTDKIYTKNSYSMGDFLVFGPESRGIPEDILNKYKQNCVTIPMKKETRSLNLSNSVAIAAYEAFRQFNINLD
ncbi:MAG: tRNA (cytidine(34)-2'-O)-methyltransferase [Candidatus Gastranaerophilales bacterium]|nr:tRNA (cytidine(34)-2'-O)-methyltransferase [Candidatus Gastranaerophilales bacterium]